MKQRCKSLLPKVKKRATSNRTTMIRLIAGLGNPGSKYEGTRHNAGFLFADRITATAATPWQEKKTYRALICPLDNSDTSVIKPLTFMNLSGDSVAAFANYFKITPQEILVAHDELDLAPGSVRLKNGGGHGGHNGLRDIIAKLGSREFYRLRIGIGHPGSGSEVVPYVLGKPPTDEKEQIIDAVERVADLLPELLSGEFQWVMNQLHQR